jgi:hypothetical protein
MQRNRNQLKRSRPTRKLASPFFQTKVNKSLTGFDRNKMPIANPIAPVHFHLHLRK